MGYADGLLSTGERITHREKQHWFVFVWGARFTILALIAAVVIAVLTSGMSPDGASGTLRIALTWLVAALFIGGLLVLAWTVLRYLNQEYVLTNRRVVQVSGVLNKTAMDSSLEKINDARLTQSVFGRIFGFGDLDILTAADTGVDQFRMIVDPIGFKKAMLDAKHEYERDVAGGNIPPGPPLRAEASASPAAGATPGTVRSAAPRPVGDETVSTAVPGSPQRAALSPDELTRTLSSLADLRDRGAITVDEYERKKADLLGRL